MISENISFFFLGFAKRSHNLRNCKREISINKRKTNRRRPKGALTQAVLFMLQKEAENIYLILLAPSGLRTNVQPDIFAIEHFAAQCLHKL